MYVIVSHPYSVPIVCSFHVLNVLINLSMSVVAPMDLNSIMNSAVIILFFRNVLFVTLLYISCAVVFERGANTPAALKLSS